MMFIYQVKATASPSGTLGQGYQHLGLHSHQRVQLHLLQLQFDPLHLMHSCVACNIKFEPCAAILNIRKVLNL